MTENTPRILKNIVKKIEGVYTEARRKPNTAQTRSKIAQTLTYVLNAFPLLLSRFFNEFSDIFNG